MTAIKDMLGSERAVFALVLVAAITVLTALGHVTFAEWQTYTKEIAFVFIGSKTVTTAIEAWKGPATGTLTVTKIDAGDDPDRFAAGLVDAAKGGGK